MGDAARLIIVVDTQLFLRAAINGRSLPARLLFEYGPRYALAVSPEIRAEVAEVLNRSSLRSKFPALTDERVAELLAILDIGMQVQAHEILPVSRDPKDDIFLAVALEAHADYLISEDKDLLVIKKYAGTRIIDALEFLRILEDSSES